MSHAYHEALENHIPWAIWHSGCQECENRSRLPFSEQLATLDPTNAQRAVQRALAWDAGRLAASDPCELPLFRNILAAITLIGRPIRIPTPEPPDGGEDRDGR